MNKVSCPVPEVVLGGCSTAHKQLKTAPQLATDCDHPTPEELPLPTQDAAPPTVPSTALPTAPPTAPPTVPPTVPSTAPPTVPPTVPSTALPTAPPTAPPTSTPIAVPVMHSSRRVTREVSLKESIVFVAAYQSLEEQPKEYLPSGGLIDKKILNKFFFGYSVSVGMYHSYIQILTS